MNDISLYMGRIIISAVIVIGLIRAFIAIAELAIRTKNNWGLRHLACVIKVQKKHKAGCFHGDLTLYCKKCGKLVHVSASEGFVNARCCGAQMECLTHTDIKPEVVPEKATVNEAVKPIVKKAITTQEIMSKLKKGDKNNA